MGDLLPPEISEIRATVNAHDPAGWNDAVTRFLAAHGAGPTP